MYVFGGNFREDLASLWGQRLGSLGVTKARELEAESRVEGPEDVVPFDSRVLPNATTGALYMTAQHAIIPHTTHANANSSIY